MTSLEKFNNIALEYCNIRLTITSVFLILFALSIFFLIILLARKNQQQYYLSKINGKIKKIKIQNIIIGKESLYYLIIFYKYTINKKNYDGVDIYDKIGVCKEEAKCIYNKLLNDTINIYYNKQSPNISQLSIVEYNHASNILIGMGICFVFVGYLLYKYKSNPIVCGLTVGNDTYNLASLF
jgi:hypothetical protein